MDVKTDKNNEQENKEIWFIEKNGRKRPGFEMNCNKCNKLFVSQLRRKEITKYCSLLCSRLGSIKKITLKCAQCNKDFDRTKYKSKTGNKHGFKFCSKKCKNFAQSLDGNIKEIRPPHFGNGIRNYRSKALRIIGPYCQQCGYDKEKQMLDVHHKDQNRDNNKIDNLEVLCVWCHTLKTRKIQPHKWDGDIKIESGIQSINKIDMGS